jgi:hypothetical protein
LAARWRAANCNRPLPAIALRGRLARGVSQTGSNERAALISLKLCEEFSEPLVAGEGALYYERAMSFMKLLSHTHEHSE